MILYKVSTYKTYLTSTYRYQYLPMQIFFLAGTISKWSLVIVLCVESQSDKLEIIYNNLLTT